MKRWTIAVTTMGDTDFATTVRADTSGQAIAHVARQCSEQGIEVWIIEIKEESEDAIRIRPH